MPRPAEQQRPDLAVGRRDGRVGFARERFLVFGVPNIGAEEVDEVLDTLHSGWIGAGPKVQRFEECFRQYVGARHAVAVNSCTAALHLSLVVAGVGPGDEVITTTMTFPATVNTIIHCGATPVLVDCDPLTGLIDVRRMSEAVTSRTRAVVPVHLYGRPCDMDAVLTFAERHGLVVVEDAAHAVEAVYRGRKIGTLGHLTCFSFYVTKNMTTGEGGMITTGDVAMAEKLKTYALHGMSGDAWKRFSADGYRHYEVIFPGFKYNMTDLQASIGLHQLAKVDGWLARRNVIWRRYNDAFADLPVGRPAPDANDCKHARHLYTVLVDAARTGCTRDEFMQRLHDMGIGSGVHYRAVHLHQYYRERFGYRPADFPAASWLSERTLSLPLSAKLSDADVDDVIRAVRLACGPF
jgi:dTDP-4-amino-4,6-dideoxygalactose transaminase